MQEYIHDIYQRYNTSVSRWIDADGVARTFGIAPIDVQMQRNYELAQYMAAQTTEFINAINTAFPEHSFAYAVANLALFLYTFYNTIDTLAPDYGEIFEINSDISNTDF